MGLNGWIRLVCVLMGAVVVGGSARGQNDPLADRTVASWDFEERELHLEPVPMRWFRVNGGKDVDGGRFPAWNRAELSDAGAVSGSWSVMLPTRGGSTAMRLASGVVPVLPGARYAVTAMVRTEGLHYSAGFVRAWTLDARLDVIGSSVAISEPVRTQGQWKRVTFIVEAPEDAAWFQMELLLLQPDEIEGFERAPAEVVERDFSGSAWFDDVALVQVPRIEMRTTRAAGIFEMPEKPTLEIRIEDLTRRPLDALVVVYDIDGNEVARRSMPRTQMGRPIEWMPELPGFGWYRAILNVSGDSATLGSVRADFVWGPTLPRVGHPRGLGVVADMEGVDAAALEAMLRFVEPGTIETAVQPERGSAGTALAAALLEREHELIVRADAPHFVDEASMRSWMGGVADIVARLGERARRVMITDSGDEAAFWDSKPPLDLGLLRAALRETVPDPIVMLPWDLRHLENDVALSADGLSYFVPWTAPPGAVEIGTREWSSASERAIVLEVAPSSMGGRRAACESVSKKAALAWAAGYPRVLLSDPFVMDDRGVSASPELAAWRMMAHTVGGASFEGMLPTPKGVRALIGQRADTGVLIAWNDGAEPRDAVIRGYMGEGPFRARDIFGNEVPFEVNGGVVRMTLRSGPVILDGIDPRILKFRSGIRFEPKVIPARVERLDGDVVISNPWETPISGRLRLREPGESAWEFLPRVIPFRLEGGESRGYAVEFSFGPGEESGRRELIAEVEVRGERDLPVMYAPMPIEIAMEGIDLTTAYRFSPRRDGRAENLVISAVVTNVGSQPISLEAVAFAPGFAGRQAPVGKVYPGESVTRTFVFELGSATLRGKGVRVGLVEIDGTGRLNRTIEIDP
ncbi:MAG: hypothetical protein R3B46_05400 [Phycisphaerales bacterium]